ncbi:hypothetical protein [Amycolatopsis tucumanensis]|uniref:SHOCT domain-containing protein n=1 Tax=Amycolatopsis tucumanensis TaxID=401106 RepID=A0ABP7JXA5_9PSEU|nr:hypothetical protein [Amycolatopsis tucumanensis]MCF6428494.1 hypothetical protein [Amycolatopsis tucumanensis]
MAETATQAANTSWQAIAIGVLLFALLAFWTISALIGALRRWRRDKRDLRAPASTLAGSRASFVVPSWLTDRTGTLARMPKWRRHDEEIPKTLLDEEAAAVRDLLAGRLDRAAYRERLHELASHTASKSKHRQ